MAAIRTVARAAGSRPVGVHEFHDNPEPSPLGWAEESRTVGPECAGVDPLTFGIWRAAINPNDHATIIVTPPDPSGVQHEKP